jgi:hypothetical protein
MNKIELRTEYLRLSRLESKQDVDDMIDIFLEYFFKTILALKVENEIAKELKDAILVNQMLFTKLAHLKKIITGIEFTSKAGAKLNNIIDPTVVGSLVRTIFETVGMFNLIYIQANAGEERLVLYNLWVSAGLSYRQKFTTAAISEEVKEKARNEKQQIENLKNQIEHTTLFKNLNQRDKDKIYSKITSKEYNVRFENGHVKGVAGFQEFIKIAGVRPRIMDNMYTHFSLNSHPSNVSVFQFGDMFRAEEPRFFELVNFNVKSALFLLGVFAADFIKLFPVLKNIYDAQPLIDQIMINFFNNFMRGDAYDINKEYEALN